MSTSEFNWGIRDFYNSALKYDFGRTHQLRILEWQQFGNSVFSGSSLPLYLETASLPGKEISNIVIPYAGMNYNIPGMTSYTGASLPVVFRCDSNYNILSIFESYMQDTHDDENSNGRISAPGEDSYLILTLIGKDLKPVKSYKMIGTSIHKLGPIQYNLGDSGTITKIDATLTYHYWRTLS